MLMTVKRVLVIDDDADIREVASASLELVGGWEVIAAASGAEGLLLAASQQPHAILLDFMMPGMDGPTTLAHLQKNQETQDIPVIFLTGRVTADTQRQLSDMPVAGVFPKPFDPMSLPDQIMAALGWES